MRPMAYTLQNFYNSRKFFIETSFRDGFSHSYMYRYYSMSIKFTKIVISVLFLFTSFSSYANQCKVFFEVRSWPKINYEFISSEKQILNKLDTALDKLSLSEGRTKSETFRDFTDYLKNAEGRLSRKIVELGSQLKNKLRSYDQKYSRWQRKIPFSEAKRAWKSDIFSLKSQIADIEKGYPSF